MSLCICSRVCGELAVMVLGTSPDPPRQHYVDCTTTVIRYTRVMCEVLRGYDQGAWQSGRLPLSLGRALWEVALIYLLW